MRRQPPPLRFLTAVFALWVCSRALVLAPDWWVERSAAAPAGRAPPQTREAAAAPTARSMGGEARPGLASPVAAIGPGARAAKVGPPRDAPAAAPAPLGLALTWPAAAVPPAVAPDAPLPLPRQRFAASAAPAGRFSGSAWLLLRGEQAATLAPGGTLGGSQGGLRLLYRLNRDEARPLSLSLRLYSPAPSRRGAEAALGLDWRPFARLPVHLLAERRQALGRDGRSAFALALHGGVSEHPLALGFRLDAYGQGGVVGARSRHLFADGGARATLPVGGARIGAGLWGGAQPGAARLDAGPHASVRLPIAGENVRLAAEWRVRVAGGARPGSGPVLTFGSDF